MASASSALSEQERTREHETGRERVPWFRHRLVTASWPPLAAFAVGMALWQYLPPRLGMQPYILPTPTEVWRAIQQDSTEFWSGVLTSALTSLAGFALSAVLGIIAACFMATWKPVERTLFPYMIILSTVPVISIAPLIVVWFGPGNTSILIITVIVGFFPVVANTVIGLRSASTSSVDLFRIHHASTLQTLVRLRFPTSLPFLFASLKVTATLAVIGTIVGEYVAGTAGSSGGLGYIIIVAANRLETALVFAAAIASAALGIIFFVVVSMAASKVLGSWHESAIESE